MNCPPNFTPSLNINSGLCAAGCETGVQGPSTKCNTEKRDPTTKILNNSYIVSKSTVKFSPAARGLLLVKLKHSNFASFWGICIGKIFSNFTLTM